MIFYLSFGIMVISVIFMSLFAIMPVFVKEKTVRFLWMAFVVSFSVFIYFNEPNSSTDLWRHYYCMDEIRNGVVPTMYGAQFGFVLFLWVLTLFESNCILPSVVFLIIGLMVDSIAKEYIKKYDSECYLKSKILLLYYTVSLSGLNISYIVSGIRTPLVCVLFVWAYATFFNTNRKWYYVIGLLLGTVHIMAFMLLALVLVNATVNKVKTKGRTILIILISFLGIRLGLQSGLIVFLASLLPGGLGELLYTKIIDYSTVIQSQGSIQLSFVINNILVFVSLLVSLIYSREQDSFVYLLCFVAMIGGLQETVSARLMQATGLLMLPAITINCRRFTRGVSYCYTAFVYFGCLLSIFISFYSLCAHVELNGINYRDIIANLFGI